MWEKLLLLFISIHGRSCYHECRAVLSERGYRLYESTALAERLANPSVPWGGDHELLAAGPKHAATEEMIKSEVW